jgi:hypothetical protein
MSNLNFYFDFLRTNGFPLSTINPGSNEFALEYKNALLAIEMLKETGKVILGGDILSRKDGRLIYIIDLWGDDYYYLIGIVI